MKGYETRESKAALIAESTGLERTRLVHEQGIGVELPTTLFGWIEDRLVVTAQTPAPLAQLPQERFHVVAASAFAIRRGLGATAFTLVQEGFVASEPGDKPLAVRYAEGDENVMECLWIVQQDSGHETMLMVALPYSYDLRDVVFEEAEMEEVSLDTFGAYSDVIQRALEAPVGDLATPRSLSKELRSLGMVVQTFRG